MGIDISAARVVTFNPHHERRVVTDVARDPPRQTLGALEVVSVFARKTITTDDLDGNPLIYALKGKFGYTMPYGSFREIYRRGAEILPKAMDGLDFAHDRALAFILGSSSDLAERASRRAGGWPILPCLAKATFGEVLAAAPPMHMIEKRYRGAYGKQLRGLQKASAAAAFEMKKVMSPLRGYFRPVVATDAAAAVAGHRVLLVDDILGSGTSITAAAEALQAFAPLSVYGLTLMGKLT